MAKNKGQGIQNKGKVVNVPHDVVGDGHLLYAIFPIGFRYNQDLQMLRRGDIIRFLDGSEHYVWSVSKLALNSAIVDYLCWMRYGFSIDRAIALWKDRLRLAKMDVGVMSEDRCLIVFYERNDVRYE